MHGNDGLNVADQTLHCGSVLSYVSNSGLAEVTRNLILAWIASSRPTVRRYARTTVFGSKEQ